MLVAAKSVEIIGQLCTLSPEVPLVSTNLIRRALHARHWSVLIGTLVIALAAGSAEAVPVNVTDPNPHYTAVEMPAPPHPEAGVVAHLWTESITLGTSLYFQNAWNAWNAAQPVGSQWTLATSSFLIPDALTINVSQFDAQSFHGANHTPNVGVGGVEVSIEWSYGGPEPVDDLYWSQGLFLNYNPGSYALVPGFSAMDVASFNNLVVGGNVWSEPYYPYQYVDQSYYDFAKAPYDTGFFEADAFLSKADFDTRTLTIYDGVHYGFYLYATPEPASWALMAMALVAATIVMTRKQRLRSGSHV